MLDPEYSLQDLLRCHICETPVTPLYCDVCNKYLCKNCKRIHLSDDSTEHKVVSFELRGSSNKCHKHSAKVCEHYCKQCDIPVCEECTNTKEHRNHIFVDIVNKLKSHRFVIQGDLQELENSIYPNNLNTKSRIQKINAAQTISEIEKTMTDLKRILESNDVKRIFAYMSMNAKFREKQYQLNHINPSYPKGLLFALSATTGYFFDPINSPGAMASPSSRPLLEKPQILTEIFTIYKGPNSSCSVSCINGEEIWTCGSVDSILRLYNIQGKIVKSIKTMSGNPPSDITVSSNGDLFYTDYDDKSVNIVRNMQIQEVVRLQGLKPRGSCITGCGEILVVMDSDDYSQTKVVRYSDTKEKQSIQFNDKGQPLFLTGPSLKFICENNNFDVCVSDCDNSVVVVVNLVGKFRFIYTGPLSFSKRSFKPCGIDADSQCRILIADRDNHCIHIIDKDGQFLRLIDNCALYHPLGLSVDAKDNLFVNEWFTGKVEKIQYCS